MGEVTDFLEEAHSGAAKPERTEEAHSAFVFGFDGVQYAVEPGLVESIVDYELAVQVPLATTALLGLIQLRGRIVSVAHDPLARSSGTQTPQRVVVCRAGRSLIGLPAAHTQGIQPILSEDVARGIVHLEDGPATRVHIDVVARALGTTVGA